MLSLRSRALCAAVLIAAIQSVPVAARQNAQPGQEAGTQPAGPQTPPIKQSGHASAEAKAPPSDEAAYGSALIGIGELDLAKTECEAALKASPTSEAAKKCLNDWDTASINSKLDTAENYLQSGDTANAIKTASPWIHSKGSADQQRRAAQIVRQAKGPLAVGFWQGIPEWLRQILIALGVLIAAVLLVNRLRWLWRKLRLLRNWGLAPKTVWRLQPLTQASGSTEGSEATDGLLDAIARLGDELDRHIWEPKLLLLRPTPPATFEPAVISEFLVHSQQHPSNGAWPLSNMALFPPMKGLREELDFHEVRLDDALKDLQLKIAAGIDAGALLRFLMTIWRWVTAGSPVISGSVEIGTSSTGGHPEADKNSPGGTGAAYSSGKTISLHIAAHGIDVRTVSITTSSSIQAGIDCVQLAAERAAFKFLVRMRYPEMTNDEVNGLAALRQGSQLFTEFAGTCPGGGSAAITRVSALNSAARNLEFFRSAVPPAYEPRAREDAPAVAPRTGLSVTAAILPQATRSMSAPAIPAGATATGQNTGAVPGSITTAVPAPPQSAEPSHQGSTAETFGITDEMRQAALLAEGVAHSLAGTDADRDAAMNCFQQLQEWPGADKRSPIWQQAAYNEAIVYREMGLFGQCVLMLTEFLGDLIPDIDSRSHLKSTGTSKSLHLVEPIKLVARVARLGAFAEYTAEDWATLPPSRARLLTDDAEQLVKDLQKIWQTADSPHDSRMARYLLGEALRSIGHVELRRVIQDLGTDRIYDDDNRPAKLLKQPLDIKKQEEEQAVVRLRRSVGWLKSCEDFRPCCGLYCDLSESFLLLGRFREAQGYARHATLKASLAPGSAQKLDDNPLYERAFYLAAESFYMCGKPELAKRYAQRFAGTVTLDEFKALRTLLNMNDSPVNRNDSTGVARNDPGPVGNAA